MSATVPARADATRTQPELQPALSARGLSKHYGEIAALQSLDLDIAAGEVFCLLGANGAGKTTTINLFLGFTAPSAGQALVQGIDPAREPLEARRHLAYIPENVNLYRNLSGLENLAYFTSLATGTDPRRDELLYSLVQTGLTETDAERRVSGYSKGMRQKVGIAIALAKRASVLLLDEPTSGLDPQASNEFSALLNVLRDRGAAILMATHDLFRAKESGTRVGIMKHGRLVHTIATAEIGHTHLERVYLDHMRS
jgi:ABC-2 type transport system ATP-binding protein